MAAPHFKNGPQIRRLLALVAIYDSEPDRGGADRGVTLQIVRDWALKFYAAGPDALVDRRAPGRPSLLDAAQRAAVVEAI